MQTWCFENGGIHSSIVRSVEIFHNAAGQASSASTTAKEPLQAMRRLEHLQAQPHEKRMQAMRWVEHLRAQTQKKHLASNAAGRSSASTSAKEASASHEDPQTKISTSQQSKINWKSQCIREKPVHLTNSGENEGLSSIILK